MNRDLFREVNLQIHRLTAGFEGHVEYVCECGGALCETRLAATHEQFAAVLAERGCYLVASDHAGPENEVVRAADGYVVVRLLAASPLHSGS